MMLTPQNVLGLQQRVGNASVARALGGVRSQARAGDGRALLQRQIHKTPEHHFKGTGGVGDIFLYLQGTVNDRGQTFDAVIQEVQAGAASEDFSPIAADWNAFWTACASCEYEGAVELLSKITKAVNDLFRLQKVHVAAPPEPSEGNGGAAPGTPSGRNAAELSEGESEGAGIPAMTSSASSGWSSSSSSSSSLGPQITSSRDQPQSRIAKTIQSLDDHRLYLGLVKLPADTLQEQLNVALTTFEGAACQGQDQKSPACQTYDWFYTIVSRGETDLARALDDRRHQLRSLDNDEWQALMRSLDHLLSYVSAAVSEVEGAPDANAEAAEETAEKTHVIGFDTWKWHRELTVEPIAQLNPSTAEALLRAIQGFDPEVRDLDFNEDHPDATKFNAQIQREKQKLFVVLNRCSPAELTILGGCGVIAAVRFLENANVVGLDCHAKVLSVLELKLKPSKKSSKKSSKK